MATLTGVTPSTVYSILTSGAGYSIVRLKKLCDVLNITLGEFFQPGVDGSEQEIKYVRAFGLLIVDMVIVNGDVFPTWSRQSR
jgi:transcriptional regulator with XRE-family HTH domain